MRKLDDVKVGLSPGKLYKIFAYADDSDTISGNEEGVALFWAMRNAEETKGQLDPTQPSVDQYIFENVTEFK